jgi:hypothetical protein
MLMNLKFSTSAMKSITFGNSLEKGSRTHLIDIGESVTSETVTEGRSESKVAE